MTSVTPPSKRLAITLWVLSVIVGLAFLGSAAGKLSGAMTADLGAGLGVPAWAVPIIGIIELVAAIALMVPRTRFYGAAVLVATMVGAVLTHFAAADVVGSIAPLVLGLLAGAIAWSTQPVWVADKIGRGARA